LFLLLLISYILFKKKFLKVTILLTYILGIIKVSPQNQQLYYKDEIMDESKTLLDCGLSSTVAKAQSPATIGLALK